MKVLQTFLFWVSLRFVPLFILSLPFSYQIFPNFGEISQPFFEGLLNFLASTIFGQKETLQFNWFSDSRALYLNTLVILGLSILFAIPSYFLHKDKNRTAHIRYWFHVFVAYYLSLTLFKYGFSKLFKHQFYLPEPNTLFTPLGQLSRDILYWSSMGSSYFYTVMGGVLELIPACLLLFRRTRLLGAIGAAAVLSHVLLINIGFDISVKLYSTFLLFLSLILISPFLKKMYFFFIKDEFHTSSNLQLSPPNYQTNNGVLLYSIGKSLVIGLILFESLFLYFQSGNFNDDKAARPFLHGAYEVQWMVLNGDTLTPPSIKRIFFHRSGYFITQSTDDKMTDYKLQNNTLHQQLSLEKNDLNKGILNYKYQEENQESVLILNGELNKNSIELHSNKVKLEELPLLKEKLHWTLEGHSVVKK